MLKWVSQVDVPVDKAGRSSRFVRGAARIVVIEELRTLADLLHYAIANLAVPFDLEARALVDLHARYVILQRMESWRHNLLTFRVRIVKSLVRCIIKRSHILWHLTYPRSLLPFPIGTKLTTAASDLIRWGWREGSVAWVGPVDIVPNTIS